LETSLAPQASSLASQTSPASQTLIFAI
jgi:hypothetical protein